MPLALHPDARYRYVLKCDQALPKESQPAFFVRVMTVKQRDDERARVDEVLASANADETRRLLNGGLANVLVGWRNLPAPFPAITSTDSPEERAAKLAAVLDGILIPAEKMEIVCNAIYASDLSDDDLKN